MASKKSKVNVLGTEYEIGISNSKEDAMLNHADGYVDFTTQKIIVAEIEQTAETVKNIEEYQKKVTRHELIHAFLYESGLSVSSWADNEEMIDWLAIQFPKINAAFEKLEII